MDEIIVTAQKRQEDGPGLFLEKRGDYLLLEVSIENDSRDFSTRTKEINIAVNDFIAAAEKDSDITLSIIDESDFVRPLTEENFNDGLRSGPRPDTGLDKELKWVRSGDLNLAFYLPYTYDIIPDTLHSIQRVYED